MPDSTFVKMLHSKNGSANFESGEAGVGAEGLPSAVAGSTAGAEDYRTNPTNPPEPAAPCRNMRTR